ncbi:MAG: PIN domain-containing protein [Thermoanaerobaculia bacterium]
MSNEHPAKTFRPFAADAHRAFATAHAQPDINTALVFPDTNVLLAPYRGSTETLEAIRKVYARLRTEERIVVPAQVAREFARNRLDLLAEAHKYVRDAKSVSVNGQFDPPPILQELPEYVEARRQLDAATEAIKMYRSALDRLADLMAGWQSKDPVLETYEKLFDAKSVREVSLGAQTLEEIRTARYAVKIPPGFRDKTKDDGGIGDLVIWLTILEAAAAADKDAIFVTEEAKIDWFHRSADQRLFPRYELVEEFKASVPGRSFSIMTLAELLKVHGASERVVAEVQKAADVAESPFRSAQKSDEQMGLVVVVGYEGNRRDAVLTCGFCHQSDIQMHFYEGDGTPQLSEVLGIFHYWNCPAYKKGTPVQLRVLGVNREPMTFRWMPLPHQRL